jgi:hypothetical protein
MILFEYADYDSHEASPTQLTEAIMYATESTITEEAKDRKTNWFDASESIVRPLRDTAQCAYKTSLLTALMQTDNIGKPSAVITTKYSIRQRINTLTKLP